MRHPQDVYLVEPEMDISAVAVAKHYNLYLPAGTWSLSSCNGRRIRAVLVKERTDLKLPWDADPGIYVCVLKVRQHHYKILGWVDHKRGHAANDCRDITQLPYVYEQKDWHCPTTLRIRDTYQQKTREVLEEAEECG